MPKNFIDSELWNRDWFLEMDGRSQLFCVYLNCHCDHAGIWNPSFKRFEQSTGFRINSSEYISMCNKGGACRILVLDSGKWWLTGFIEDQYKTKELFENNLAIKGVINSLRFNQVPYLSYGYKLGVSKPLQGAKEKDKEKEKEQESLKGEDVSKKDDVTIQEQDLGESPLGALARFLFVGPKEWEPCEEQIKGFWIRWCQNYQGLIEKAIMEAEQYRIYCEATGTAGQYVKTPEKWIQTNQHLTDWKLKTEQAKNGNNAQGVNRQGFGNGAGQGRNRVIGAVEQREIDAGLLTLDGVGDKLKTRKF